jgi:hypothetical protein
MALPSTASCVGLPLLLVGCEATRGSDVSEFRLPLLMQGQHLHSRSAMR